MNIKLLQSETPIHEWSDIHEFHSPKIKRRFAKSTVYVCSYKTNDIRDQKNCAVGYFSTKQLHRIVNYIWYIIQSKTTIKMLDKE